jgi:hypothetical protein
MSDNPDATIRFSPERSAVIHIAQLSVGYVVHGQVQEGGKTTKTDSLAVTTPAEALAVMQTMALDFVRPTPEDLMELGGIIGDVAAKVARQHDQRQDVPEVQKPCDAPDCFCEGWKEEGHEKPNVMTPDEVADWLEEEGQDNG